MGKEEYLLKLRAESQEDLEILSSFMQDAIVPVGAMQFDQTNDLFRMMTTRFCWECEPERRKGKTYFQRIKTSLCFKNVTAVKYRGFDRFDLGALFVILHIRVFDSQHISMTFAGGGEILLSVAAIKCFMQDIPEIFWTRAKPEHRAA